MSENVIKPRSTLTIDGNEAAARIAHLVSEIMAIYPITPSSPMGELADAWSARGQTNLWGQVPLVIEMQSEAGAAGALHGALQGGALATTFTASQGLLLMIPNMFKIAGELTPFVMHVAARTIATHALSIFGDHSDVMAARSTGFAMLCASSVQEAQDMALVAHAATLETRVPFLHFFDGFRTSHEVNQVLPLDEDDIRALIDHDLVLAHRARGLSSEHPVLRGSAQNPDVFFQAREAANSFYDAVPGRTQAVMDQLAARTGRVYRLFDYKGAPDAERVIVAMGSGCGAIEDALAPMLARGEKVGLVKVRLFRPFSAEALMEALPSSVRAIAVLDRTKEPGALGEPLYMDVVTALAEERQRSLEQRRLPVVIGGRYGLSSKEFTPAMAETVFHELEEQKPEPHFTVGITDDVTHSSLVVDPDVFHEPDDVFRAVFYGLGSDGTVGATKNSVKIIAEHGGGEGGGLFAQGYFVYDSKKAGSVTVSHLRFGPRPIGATYLIQEANLVACHQFSFLDHVDVLATARQGATFLLNSPYGPDQVWAHLPVEIQRQIIQKQLRFFVVDGLRVARDAGLGTRINTALQTCFFALSDVMDRQEAIDAIKASIEYSYRKRGEAVLRQNFAAVDGALAALFEVTVPAAVEGDIHLRPPVPAEAPDFVQRVTAMMLAGMGDLLPVSALPVDGTFPTDTARWEKRSIANELPIWDPDICIDCAKCALVCPHAAIRMKVFAPEALEGQGVGGTDLPSKEWKAKDFPGARMTIQVAPDDCTGCGVCVDVCPAHAKELVKHKAINMEPAAEHMDRERVWFDAFLQLPEADRSKVKVDSIKGSQMLRPLFEFSGACAGCGETPYLKLLTQMFGDRVVIANATGCSSIYGGNLPTTPWATNEAGRGPAWANSLFEDNAEFGLGIQLALEQRRARERDADIPEDAIVEDSVWIVGGDGWAYDIGFGGLDHVLASGRNVNILVLDTEVYSNTGGQASKATPRGAVAKFAAMGKTTGKKDLGMLAASYGNVYVAQIAMGADNAQTVKAFAEAESYPGVSLIIAYSTCIAHGIDMSTSMSHQGLAVKSGYWPLYRYDPRAPAAGTNALHLDSKAPSIPLKDFALTEARFAMLARARPQVSERLLAEAQDDVNERWHLYEQLAGVEHGDLAVTDADDHQNGGT